MDVETRFTEEDIQKAHRDRARGEYGGDVEPLYGLEDWQQYQEGRRRLRVREVERRREPVTCRNRSPRTAELQLLLGHRPVRVGSSYHPRRKVGRGGTF